MKRLIGFLAVSAALLLTACGGGGGCAGTPNNGTNTCTSSGGTTGGGTTPTTSAQVSVVFTDSSGVALTSNGITSSSIFFVQATVLDANGAAVPNAIVTFSTDAAVGSLSPITALTGSTGVARVQIAPASLAASGAALVTAQATVNGAQVSGQAAYQVGASNVALSAVTATPTTVTALQTATIRTNVTVNGAPATAGQVSVTFSANCGYFTTLGQTSISVSTASGGAATATWQSVSACGGATVNFLASATGATSTSGSVVVTAIQPANVLYDTATATTLVVASATSGTKQSTVSFKVVDPTNTGMANQSVTISLDSQSIGAGVQFNNGGALTSANQTVMTNANGIASVTIQSGTLPTPVVVTGAITVNATVMTATSSGIVVTSGKPSQLFTSLSATKLNIEALNTDGVTTTLTLRTADRNGNPVPIGTAVTFIASHGTIGGSCLTDAASSCQVTYTSSGTRPAEGVVTILSYLDGEESFLDADGNNIYNAGDTFAAYEMGQAFLDVDHSGGYNAGDQAIGTATGASSACPTGSYPSIPLTCDGVWSSSIRVRKPINIGLSSGFAKAAKVTTGTPPVLPSGFRVFIQDAATGSVVGMPTGTTVTAAVSTLGVACAVTSVSPAPSPNQVAGSNFDILLNDDGSCATPVIVNIKVTTPAGTITTLPYQF